MKYTHLYEKKQSKIGKIKIFLWNIAYFLHEKHKNCPKFPKYFSNSHSDIIWVGIQRITINLMCNEVLNWSSIFQYKWQKVQNVPIIDKYFKISPIKRIWNTFSTLNFRARFLCTCDFIVKATTCIAFRLPRQLTCLVNLKTARQRLDQPLKALIYSLSRIKTLLFPRVSHLLHKTSRRRMNVFTLQRPTYFTPSWTSK